MCVFILDNAIESLRGELTKWLLEVKPGVIVGNCTKTVRDRLWKRVIESGIKGGLLIYSNKMVEQGYVIEMFGEPKRRLVDIDGLQLIEKIYE